jgi:uncharacterized SAM-binding protein YcdF (DUF218 family)
MNLHLNEKYYVRFMKNRKGLRKTVIILGSFLIAASLTYVVRRPIMRVFGNYLIQEDELSQCDALFVLSGNPKDRAMESARLLKAGYAPKVDCTGESVHRILLVVGDSTDEAGLSRMELLAAGIPDNQIEVLHIGTSTREESEAILAYCKIKGFKKIMVVSDKFHTNRIDYAFRDVFEDAGIQLVLRGSPSNAYSESNWWANEEGLIMVNNEYIKLLYYYVKH